VTEKVERCVALGSLARLARFGARRARGHGWPATLLVGRWHWLRTTWRGFMYGWLLLGAAALIVVPWVPNPNFGPFKSAEDAEGFLRTMWQVQAAALALSLAIIVFAVQVYRSSTHERYGGTLRRFIRASWLQEGYELGVVSLLLTAAVLLGVGHGGPSGSAGAVAAGVSLLSIGVLPLLLSRALHTTHRDFLREERESRLRAAVRDQVDREVEARLAVVLLNAVEAEEPLTVTLYGGGRGGGLVNVAVAGDVGVVADIRLFRLIRLARDVRDVGGLTLGTYLYSYVGAETGVLLLPLGTGARELRRGRRIVKVRRGRRRDETLSRYLADLEEEAVAAIRVGGPATYEGVVDAYMETLMEFPLSWQRYGQEYTPAVARGIEFFPTGPVDTIARQFYTNVVEALRGGSDEVLLDAAYLPINACTRALQYRADGLLSRMIGLSAGLLLAAWTHGGEKGRLLEGRIARYLIEFTRLHLQPGLNEGETEDRLRFGGYVRLVYDQIGAMLKLGVDQGKTEFVQGLDGDWGTLLKHWEVATSSPHPAAIPHLERAVAEGAAGAAENLAAARANAKLAELNEELAERRTLLRFGLALWAWRQQPQSWRDSFAHFSTQMGGLGRLTEITTKGVSAEFRDSVPWSDWILGTLQEGEVHAIPGVEAVVETFITAALRLITPGEDAPVLPPAEWMAVYLDHARRVLDGAVADERNSDLPDVAERVAKLREALEAGARAWRERERLTTIEAPLVEEKVAQFCAQARTSLEGARVVPGLLRVGGAVTEMEVPPDDPPIIQSRTHKALFVEDSNMIGAEMVAGDVGRQLAHLELRTLIEPMAEVEARQLVADDPGAENAPEFVEQLHGLVSRALQVAERTSVALFLPLQWQLAEALGLSFLGGGTSPPEEWGLSEGAANDFAGVFEGAAAFHFPEVPKDRLYIVDLSGYVTAEAWQPSDEKAVTVTVLSEEEARERAQRDPGRDEIGEDEIVRRWLETALVTVDPGLRLSDERDESAVIAIELPAILKREA
jgi:hypothetical protein